ncbi:MAG: outer membrane beta-barrel protein [Verrucomicrobiales bacterium]|jgi:opacity protein-like surface antigen|nr:outer membrane beta-barrel protein [Verrucomicrobiales bacterium]
MKKSAYKTYGLALLLAVTLVSSLAAQTQTPSDIGSAYNKGGDYPYRQGPQLYEFKDGNIVPTPENPEYKRFMASVAPREEARDSYFGFGLGVNAAQQGDVSYSGADGSASGRLKSTVGFVTGIRGGHTWQLGNAPGNLLAISLEGELLYSYNRDTNVKGTYANGGEISTDNFDSHIWALMMNPILRFQAGKFVPYVGAGIGGAIVLAANRVDDAANVIWADSRYGVAFAFQGLVGADYFVSESWSIFAEYKYLGLIGLNFNHYVTGESTNDKLKMDGILGNHLLTIGAKFHF